MGKINLISWICFAVAGIFGAGLTYLVLSGGAPFELAMLLVPGFPFSMGLLIHFVDRLITSGNAPPMEWAVVGVFVGFGLLVIAQGLFGFDDWTEGIFVVLFGCVFVGVGWLTRKLFVAPKGKKWLEIPESSVSRGHYQRKTSWAILVDENVSDEETEKKVAEFRAGQLAARKDWSRNRIQSNPALLAGLVWLATGLGALIALGLALTAYFFDPFFWLPAAGVAFMATTSGIGAVRAFLRQKKFGDSHLVLAQNPVVVGQTAAGEIETSIPVKRAPGKGFTVRLTCLSHWKTTDHDGVEGTEAARSKRLWKDEKPAEAIIRAGKPGLIIPFSFNIPADMPHSSLGGGEGIRWQVSARAEVMGLDFLAEFAIPVVAAE